MTTNQFLKRLAWVYILCTIAVTMVLWRYVGILPAWLFCAVACGIPALVLETGKKD